MCVGSLDSPFVYRFSIIVTKPERIPDEHEAIDRLIGARRDNAGCGLSAGVFGITLANREADR